MNIDKKLYKILNEELGKNTADLFSQFYDGNSFEEQLGGARELLVSIVGIERAVNLLKNLTETKDK